MNKQPDHAITFEFEPRDYLYALGLDFDIDSQLIAIRSLLERNRKAAGEIQDEIKLTEERARRLKGLHSEWAVDEWVNQVHHSAYQEAAHSMSAIGMLAPFVETIFHQCFLGLGNLLYPASRPTENHERWNAAHSLQWDCHFFFKNKRANKDVAKGIVQLWEALGLADKPPAALHPTVSALFKYRNNMFHNGFEWPNDIRDDFAEKIRKEHWPTEWFVVATTGDKPWIFYMSDPFIHHVLTTMDQVLETLGLLVRDRLAGMQKP